jgi:hypothetical protein
MPHAIHALHCNMPADPNDLAHIITTINSIPRLEALSVDFGRGWKNADHAIGMLFKGIQATPAALAMRFINAAMSTVDSVLYKLTTTRMPPEVKSLTIDCVSFGSAARLDGARSAPGVPGIPLVWHDASGGSSLASFVLKFRLYNADIHSPVSKLCPASEATTQAEDSSGSSSDDSDDDSSSNSDMSDDSTSHPGPAAKTSAGPAPVQSPGHLPLPNLYDWAIAILCAGGAQCVLELLVHDRDAKPLPEYSAALTRVLRQTMAGIIRQERSRGPPGWSRVEKGRE